MWIGYVIGALFVLLGLWIFKPVIRRGDAVFPPRFVRRATAGALFFGVLGSLIIAFCLHVQFSDGRSDWNELHSGDFLAYGIGMLLVVTALYTIVTSIKDREGPRGEPAVPPAQLVTSDGKSPLRTQDPNARPRGSVFGGVALGVVTGGLGLLIMAVWKALEHSPPSDWGKKGRVLRLRGKAALPLIARDREWSDETVPRTEHLSDAERAVLAELWLISAQMEHASVPAFSQLSLHLAALGAPSILVEKTHVAALDEIRHARRCFAIASAFAGTPLSAGPIAELRAPDATPIDPIRLAIGTLVDGCLAEGIAADVARTASSHATDPVVRDALAMIGRDEETHAELGWLVLEWTLAQPGVRRAVEARVASLDQELAPKLPELSGFSGKDLAIHGVLDQETIGEIAASRIAAVRSRFWSIKAPSESTTTSIAA